MTLLLTAAVVLLSLGIWTLSAGAGVGAATGAPTGAPTGADAHTDALLAGGDAAPRSTGDARPTRGDAPAEPAARPPAPPGEPRPLEDFGDVVVQRPVVRVDGVTLDDPLPAVLGHQEVRFATVLHTATIAVADGGGQLHEATVAAVDPRGFRVLTPQVTADADNLWQHLVDGGAVVHYEAAERLGAQLGEALTLPDRPAVRVGAIAALGDPAPADVIVSMPTGHQLGLEPTVSLLVSLNDAVRPSRLAPALGELAGGEATPLVEDRVIELGRTHVATDQWDDVWDRLAQCESGGRWHLDSGNGYFGGLQFLPSSWRWVGGTGMPHEASREEQIARAKILLAHQGWGAWPACSRALGFR